jgi:hypothetical protein
MEREDFLTADSYLFKNKIRLKKVNILKILARCGGTLAHA